MREITGELKELLDSYKRGPTLVADAIRGIEGGALNARRPGSDWSIRDLLMHLADAELVRGYRIRLILAEDEPAIPSWDQDRWTRRLQYLWRSPEAAIALFDQLCFSNAELLRWSDKTAWERTGVEADGRAVSARTLVERGVGHHLGHAGDIAATREAIGR